MNKKSLKEFKDYIDKENERRAKHNDKEINEIVKMNENRKWWQSYQPGYPFIIPLESYSFKNYVEWLDNNKL